MKARNLMAGLLGGMLLLGGCFGGGNTDRQSMVSEFTGGANPFLWRASLDTLEDLPLQSADPFGGTIIFDWRSYPEIPDERVKATVYILDSRLRADGVKVSVFRQVKQDGEWVDAEVDAATGIQLENAILNRARNLKATEVD